MDLTVAVCVYNAEKFIEQTLESLMNQTFGDFKLLIVNDCSTDRSIEVIDKFFAKNPRQYELINFDNNHGIGYARRSALEKADTKYMLYIDADDLIDPTLIEKLYTKVTSDSKLMAVTCWSRFIDMSGYKLPGGTFLGVKDKAEFMDKAEKGKLFFMPIHTIFDREAALQAGGFVTAGFPDGKPRYQDYCEELDLWTRMSDLYIQGRYFATVPEALYLYRKSTGLSSNHFNMILKMRYTKCNVRRRRKGEKDLTFIEFYDSLSDKEIKALKNEAFAADSLRNGAILLKRGNIIKGSWLLMRSFIAKPSYFIDKLKHNI